MTESVKKTDTDFRAADRQRRFRKYSKELTDTDELGALVQYPDDGTDATDHLRPSALQHKQQSIRQLSGRFLANVDCSMERGDTKEK